MEDMIIMQDRTFLQQSGILMTGGQSLHNHRCGWLQCLPSGCLVSELTGYILSVMQVYPAQPSVGDQLQAVDQ